MAAISLISTFLMVLCLYGYGTEAQEVVRIGNEIKASMSGINTAGNIVLLNDIVFSEGILYAFAAFFRSQKEAVLQIWAPIDNDSNYKLVYEMPHLPSVTMAREDIYIAAKLNKKCLRVENGYRVGVYFREEPTSISYTFQKNNPKVLRHELVNSSNPIRVGSNVKFDSLAFPYAFSLAGYILKVKFNSTQNETLVDCPQTLLIPEYADVTITSTTAPPRTGAPGATGATGPQGGAGGTGLPGFQGAAGSAGATGALGPMGINGTMGSGGYTGATGPAGNDGWLGATGIQGPSGGKGIPGPPGPPGPAGGKGTGAGNGTNTVVKPKPVVAASTFADPMMVMGLLIWLIIVTILIIIVFIIICCCLLRRRRHKEEHTAYYAKGINGEGEVGIKADSHYGMGMNGGGAVSTGSLKRVTSTTSATSVPDEAWMGTLKGDTDTVYSTDTIDDRRKKSAKEAEDGKGGYENGYENVGFENEKSDVFISNGQPVEEGLTGF